MEKILELGGEGGNITLFGEQLPTEEWVFHKEINEMLFEDIDETSIQQVQDLNKKKVYTFEEALLLVGTKWYMLVPRFIHPVFVDSIWSLLINKKPLEGKLHRWARACYPQMFELARLLRTSSTTVVFTGAGMSTESGIPDFRSKSGWWKEIDPLSVATVEALEDNYQLFHEFYSMRLQVLEDSEPHIGHTILAKWEQDGLVHLVATQNVDSLHAKAGSVHVEQLHGSISTFRCQGCSAGATKQSFLAKEPCIYCGGKLRPNVVLFGEALPEKAWNSSINQIKKAELVIVIGTSLEVYPANNLPFMTHGKTVVINRDDLESSFDIRIKGKAGEVLRKVDELLGLLG